LFIDGLSNLARKPNESTGELLATITNTMVIIKERYAAYENKIKALQNDAYRGYLDAIATKWINDYFQAALPGDIRKVMAQHDQNPITLEDMYQVATTTQR
jgi:hypothetical protein